jgi:hypothetical protein
VYVTTNYDSYHTTEVIANGQPAELDEPFNPFQSFATIFNQFSVSIKEKQQKQQHQQSNNPA